MPLLFKLLHRELAVVAVQNPPRPVFFVNVERLDKAVGEKAMLELFERTPAYAFERTLKPLRLAPSYRLGAEYPTVDFGHIDKILLAVGFVNTKSEGG